MNTLDSFYYYKVGENQPSDEKLSEGFYINSYSAPAMTIDVSSSSAVNLTVEGIIDDNSTEWKPIDVYAYSPSGSKSEIEYAGLYMAVIAGCGRVRIRNNATQGSVTAFVKVVE